MTDLKIGIRVEDKYIMERRAAIVPDHVKLLKEKFGINCVVESSSKRIFSDDEYAISGAAIEDNLEGVPVIFGVKEMPLDIFKAGNTYIFFSHTVKGQPHNMPELKKMVENKVNLIDYEKMVDENGRRTVFFGRFAGLAGVINTLWGFGKQLELQGVDNPFLDLRQAYHYHSLNEAIKVLSEIKEYILRNGLPPEITPMTICITGYGHVGNGIREMLNFLPIEEITPAELLSMKTEEYSNKKVYIAVFKEKDLVRPKDENGVFELSDYYTNPSKYISDFDKYIPHLTIVFNGMYWDKRYPKLITINYLKRNYHPDFKLKFIGDISCDPNGSIETTRVCTTIEQPVFTYDPLKDEYFKGFHNKGISTLAVDILPSELPRESSIAFSEAIFNYIPSIVNCDFDEDFERLDLIYPVKKALILHKGKFTPEYKYMEKYIL